MGAAYSSLGQTKVLYSTSLVLLGAKAKFLRNKSSVLVALEEISEIRKTSDSGNQVKYALFRHKQIHVSCQHMGDMASEKCINSKTGTKTFKSFKLSFHLMCTLIILCGVQIGRKLE